jgi:TPR repeat protein
MFNIGLNIDTRLIQTPCRLERAASTGNVDALHALGHHNHHVCRDITLAAHYYRVAADMGHPPSCVALGDIYREGGMGIVVDTSSAFSYYKMAADAGDTDGLVALGEMWENGQGVVLVTMTSGVLQQHLAKAARLYGAAADLGHAVGQSNLGRMCGARFPTFAFLLCIV